MRHYLFLLLILALALPASAQKAAVVGKVVDSSTGQPVAGASVMLLDKGITAITGPDGSFTLNGATGTDQLLIAAFGYGDYSAPLTIQSDKSLDLGQIILATDNGGLTSDFRAEQEEMLFDESILDDEEGGAQAIGALTGASDNVYYNATSYNFSVMRFRPRGYAQKYNTTYINGLPFNDLGRGQFNYSMFGGMNRAFRNRSNTYGMQASDYGMGGIGGSSYVSTLVSNYAPGFNGSVAYTNSNYMLRAMAMYSTGVNAKGWGATIGAVGRYADEGIIPGTFYNSGGLFVSLYKLINGKNSLNLTAFGAPTQRATASASYLEAFDLADNNLYNPNWGWQDGKKRSAKIVESFDPTIILNWNFSPRRGTTLNTGAALVMKHYSTSALNWRNAADPRPDYYRYLPFYFNVFNDDPTAADLYAEQWRTNEKFRQIKWDNLYQTNYLNNLANANGTNKTPVGSSYILENRHSNQTTFILNSLLQHRISDNLSMQAGATFTYARSHYFKTLRDELGGEFWLDTDTYAERDFPDNPSVAENDLNNPGRKVNKGDTFGYDYYINALKGQVWLQNTLTLPHWDVNYGIEASYTQFVRDGRMRNGRAPDNSYGKGETHRFDNAGVKAGATYKINGRNLISAHAEYQTLAPLYEYAYISPRIKDTAPDLTNERVISADLSYIWNFRNFRGSITGFWTEMYDQTERSSFYDDNLSTFVNYMLRGVHTSYKGIELGMAFNITPSVTATLAGTIADYRYKNRPSGTRSVENGSMPDSTTTVYLKNYHIGGTPSKAVNVGIDWAAPHQWFFNVNASWMGDAYVNLSPVRHEEFPNLWSQFDDPAKLEAKLREITAQEKLNDAFVLNISVGKLVYIDRKISLNFNLNIDNVLNNRKIQTYGYQQGRFDYTNYNISKYPNKYYYAQGIKVFFNVGIRF